MNRLLPQWKTKSAVVLALVVILVLAISAGGTMAYFSDNDEVKNTLSMGAVEISLDEPGWEPENGLNLTPGSQADKDPTVTAVEGDGYMRIKMEIVDGEGKPITDEARIALILQTLWYDPDNNLRDGKRYTQAQLQQMVEDGSIQSQYNQERFTFEGTQKDNPSVRFYHYNGIFSAGNGDKAVLFTDMIIPSDWHNDQIFALSGDTYTVSDNGVVEVTQKGTGYQIILTGEVIQTEGMNSAEEAFATLDDATSVIRETGTTGQEGT